MRSDLVVCCDIDGTLGLYHEHFHRFAQDWTGRTLEPPATWKGNGKETFWAHLGLSRQTYRRVKLAYRQGGLKRSMPLYTPGELMPDEFTYRVRKMRVELWLCTTRPYLMLGGIDEDTRHWCRRHRIRYDYISWGEHKYQDAYRLAKQNGQKILAVFDDDPQLLHQASRARPVDLRVEGMYYEYLMDRPWNHLSMWPRCFTFQEALTAIAEAVKYERDGT